MRTLAKRVLGIVALALAFVYAGDYLFLQLRAAYPKLGRAFGTVTMERVYAIPLKGGRTEYEMDAREPEVQASCVHSLFPHMGYRPCWYLQRNSQKPIPMFILFWHPRSSADDVVVRAGAA